MPHDGVRGWWNGGTLHNNILVANRFRHDGPDSALLVWDKCGTHKLPAINAWLVQCCLYGGPGNHEVRQRRGCVTRPP